MWQVENLLDQNCSLPFIYFLPSKQYKYPIYLPDLCIIYFPELELYSKSRAAALDRSIHIRRSSLEVEIRFFPFNQFFSLFLPMRLSLRVSFGFVYVHLQFYNSRVPIQNSTYDGFLAIYSNDFWSACKIEGFSLCRWK
jgi:hypothetical protein